MDGLGNYAGLLGWDRKGRQLVGVMDGVLWAFTLFPKSG